MYTRHHTPRLLAVFLALMTPLAAHGRAQVHRDSDVVTLRNALICTTFDLTTGAWQALDADAKPFATDLRCSISAGGQTSTSAGPRMLKETAIKDAYGAGVRAEIDHAGPRPFALLLTLYDDSPLLFVQVRIPQAKGIKIHEVTLPEGKLSVGRDIRDVCTISNYWSGQWYTEIHPVELTDRRSRWETYSHFYLAAHNRGDGKSAILGALYSKAAARIEVQADPARDPAALFFKSRCCYERNDLLVEQDTWESPPHILCAPASIFDGLDAYGAAARAHRPVPLYPSPPAGWCSWDAGASSSQKALFANVDAMKSHRLDEYGLKYIQLDDGWQQGERCSGLWRPRPDRFPAGMKGVADYIRSRGFEPGLWIGPFGEDGNQSNQKALFANGKSGGYDLSSPAFQQYLRDEMKLYVNDWGFHYIKADFLAYGSTASKTIPFDESYRQAIAIMMESLRPHRGYLMTCINHEWLTVGHADGQRLGNDVHGGDLTGLYTTLKCWPRRYFTNNTFWVGDPDMMHVNLPTDQQSQVWASFVALAGGATMSGDDITKLAPSRIEILKKAYPPQAITARPCDLFDRPTGWSPKFPRIWDCKISKPAAGDWHVVGLFNWTVDHKSSFAQPQDLTVDFAKHLALRPDRRYLVFDFWKGEYLGAFERSISVGLAPASCRVLVLHEETDRPQVLGTDRHIVSGSEIARATWDSASRTLSGETRTVKNIPYTLFIHTPPTYKLTAATANGNPAPIQPAGDYAAKITFDTGPAGTVAWSLTFAPAAKAAEPTAPSTLSTAPPPRPDPAAKDIPLAQLIPLWTDQRHDIEGPPIRTSARADLATIAPFWVCWDISAYAASHPVFAADCTCSGGKAFFEVLGDGKRIAATETLAQAQSARLEAPVQGIKQLTLICHYVDGWFSTTRGTCTNPRLSAK